MKNTIVELEQTKISPCESIIIKDPWYDRDVWCAFQEDNCSSFTHARALVSNYDDHYKDENYDFDFNNTEFLMVIGEEKFVLAIDGEIEEKGGIQVYSRLNHRVIESKTTQIGCDTAEFSFGTEKTFGAFSIKTGADGSIGEVHAYYRKDNHRPIGLFFIGSVDGDMVSPQEIMDSFKAAFGIERVKERSLQIKITDAEKKTKTPSVSENKASKNKESKDI